MKYRDLGKSGLHVSELCFGTLPMGPLQANIPLETAADILVSAIDQGITFFDTAQMYRTYPHLRRAMAQRPGTDLVISSKSTAEDYQTMEQAVQEALRELGRDYIDIFLLHAARVPAAELFVKRGGAWQCLQDYKQKGYLRAVGVSTHVVQTVEMLTAMPEVDIIFPLINDVGLGIIGGSVADMWNAVDHAAAAGKGLFSMKLLGGGNLLAELPQKIAFGRAIPAFSAHAIGMISARELEINLRIFNDQPLDAEMLAGLGKGKSWFLFEPLCKHCGKCVKQCPNGALLWQDNKPNLIRENCLLCGYCASDCPEFAIRVK